MSGSASENGSVQQAGRDHTTHSTTVSTNIRIGPWLGLVSLIAVVVGAVGTYSLMADTSGSPSGQGVSAPPQGTSGPGVPSPKAGGDSTGSARVATAPAEQWRGTLVLDTDGGMELDGKRPTSVDTTVLLASGDINLGLGDRYLVLAGSGGAVAPWEGQGELPDQAACAELVDTTGSSGAPVSVGTVVCVRTDGGRIARLQVEKLPEALAFAIRFDAVVWGLAR
ncbi:hypothetical protein MTF65_17700 [Streptomyces sp. APSN-46.1]|uniref:hypothetical protein n=1 Tax=Streptomyces sp. APSN-46.1 TaxID=2929049 RepID=UPI001FB470D6|nr:hypothetical protein [Streptomyces sp. APSN-46.1]MCJ1679140.1 hypothetical protein [Streptomyces sp. APSN-46.1]